jgi:C4-dicarboxylate-binding protein DctP
MKTSLKCWLAIVATLSLSVAAYGADFTMRLSHQYPPAHQVAKALEQFAIDVKAGTGGKVEVQVFGSEQLYKAGQNHAAVARGQVESAAILNFQWGATIPEMNISSIPFLMTHADQLKKFPSSEAAALLTRKMEDKGVKPIAWMVDANDGIFTSSKHALVKPEDFKGVKIRGLNKLFDNGLAAMGASPAAMPGSEVYQALQSGVIDAGFTGVAAAFSRRFFEVQKYGAASSIITAYSNLVVNPAWWAKLPEDARQAIQSAAHKAEATLAPAADDIDPADIKRLRDVGMTVVVLSKEQEKTLAAAMQPAVIKAFTESSPDGAKLLELVRKL